MNMRAKTINLIILIGMAGIFASCSAGGNDQGVEYAPNMYHSVPYEPLKQVTDKSSGMWVNSSEQEIGEYYTSNPNNPHEMNMREPVENTIARRNYTLNDKDSSENVYFLAERLHKDSLELAGKILQNPLPETPEVLAEGKELYLQFCQHCHGKQGGADGKVAEQYPGVPKYNSRAVKNVSGGHIYHVITHGKGRMWPHGSQMSPEERWKIVRYVQELQKL
ncbi:MAG: cytochrome c [Cytophagales bacterium]